MSPRLRQEGNREVNGFPLMIEVSRLLAEVGLVSLYPDGNPSPVDGNFHAPTVPLTGDCVARSRRQGRVRRSYASRRTSTLTARASPETGFVRGTVGICMSVKPPVPTGNHSYLTQRGMGNRHAGRIVWVSRRGKQRTPKRTPTELE